MKVQKFVMFDTVLVSAEQISKHVEDKLSKGYCIVSMCSFGMNLIIVFEKE